MDEKLAIAQGLDSLGVDVIEAGSAMTSEGERLAIKKIADSGFKAEICSYVRALTADIDTALACDVDSVHLVVPVSDLHIQIKLKADRESVVTEAGRCLWCDEICSICTTVCPNFANRTYSVTPFSLDLQKAVRTENDDIRLEEDFLFEITQKYQILHIANFCNECGNCTTFCPTSGAPFREKPRFYLTTASFKEATDGYFLSMLKGRKNLIHKHKESFATLTELPDKYIYETDFVTATFERETFRIIEVSFLTPCIMEAHFHKAAEMAVLLRGAVSVLHG